MDLFELFNLAPHSVSQLLIISNITWSSALWLSLVSSSVAHDHVGYIHGYATGCNCIDDFYVPPMLLDSFIIHVRYFIPLITQNSL